MQSSAKPEKVITAFFAGTGFNFSDKNPNHQEMALAFLDTPTPTVDVAKGFDQGMADLYNVLPKDTAKQAKKGYHGGGR